MATSAFPFGVLPTNLGLLASPLLPLSILPASQFAAAMVILTIPLIPATRLKAVGTTLPQTALRRPAVPDTGTGGDLNADDILKLSQGR